MIKSVVFDYGKVICFPPPERAGEELARAAGMAPAVLEGLRWRYRDEWDRGALTGEEYYRKIIGEGGGRPEAAAELVRLDMAGWTAVNPGTEDLMAGVKRAGLTLGVLSNMPREFLRMARRELAVFGLYDLGIFSCELGLVKPEAAIYRALIAALGCAPGEIAFFDDLPANVEAAAALGLGAFLWRGPEDARTALREKGAAL
jgi:putative hydrolase of the HAD superfamily